MNESSDGRREREEGILWEALGRAAEDFARQVARDASRFAERIERHASELARDVSREWRRSHRHERHRQREAEPEDVQRIFAEVRSVIDDVLDGVDGLIARVFPHQRRDGATSDNPTAEPPLWARMVANREAACRRCGVVIAVGEAAFAREGADGLELRCLQCGEAA